MSDFVRFAPILSDFRWGFANPRKQSADFVQFRAGFVRFGVFENQTKSARPHWADPFWEFPKATSWLKGLNLERGGRNLQGT